MKHTRRTLVLFLALACTTLTTSGRAGGSGAPPLDGTTVFNAAARLLQANYVGPDMGQIDVRIAAQRAALAIRCPAPTPCPLAQGRAAVEAVVWSLLDAHTGVIWEASTHSRADAPGRRIWSGMIARLRTASLLEVIHVDHGSPAEQAGLRPGDVVLSVNARDDMDSAGLRASFLEEAEAAQTPFALRVRRGQQAHTLRVTPTLWNSAARPSLRWNGRVAVIHVPNFAGGTGVTFNTLVSRAAAQGATGLIVDLRWNGGGQATECLSAAHSLAGDTVNVIGIGRSGQPLSEWRTTPEAQAVRRRVQTPWEGPLALLVSPRTASCGELLAYFGQRAGGTVIGRPTAGLLSTGTQGHDMPGGGILFISSVRPTLDGRMRLPSRIKPDLTVPDEDDTQGNETDLELEAAIRFIQSR